MNQLRQKVRLMSVENLRQDTTPDLGFQGLSEKGAIIVLLPFIIVMLISLVALAVDSGNLYRTKLELQTIADTSTLSAAGAYVSETNDLYRTAPVNTNPLAFGREYLQNRTRRGVQAGIEYQHIGMKNGNQNLENRYLDPLFNVTKGVNVVLEGGAYVIRTDPIVQVPTLLMQVFHDEKTTGIEASATARVAPANVVFIADISSSSLCPEVGPCLCQTSARFDPITGVPMTCAQEATLEGQRRGIPVKQKFERMSEAFMSFLGAFDPARDRVSLVLFNNSAWTAVPFSSQHNAGTTIGFNVNNFANVFSSLVDRDDPRSGTQGFVTPKGNTNISDALYTALEETARAGLLNENSDVSYILLSDGAPTGMRFRRSGTNEDILSFNLTWTQEERDPTTNALISTNSYFTPGAFIDTVGYKGLADSRKNPQLATNLLQTEYPIDPLLPMVLGCHQDYDTALELASDNIDIRAKALFLCLGLIWDIESICPQSVSLAGGVCSNVRYGLIGSVRSSLEPGQNYYRNLYYYAALEASRLIRINRGTIYSVGWGNPIAIDPSDPFQNPDDDASLKSVLLADIANDEAAATAGGYPGFLNSNYDTYIGLQQRDPGIEKRGAFYEAPDIQRVERALQLITRKIKLRLLR